MDALVKPFAQELLAQEPFSQPFSQELFPQDPPHGPLPHDVGFAAAVAAKARIMDECIAEEV